MRTFYLSVLAFFVLFSAFSARAGEDVRRVTLAGTIDFSSYVFYDRKGGPELYPLDVWEGRVKEMAEGGLSKIYLRVNYGGLTLYPSKAVGIYGEEYGNNKHYVDTAQRFINTLAAYNPLVETIRLGRKYGMEVWGWECLYDDAVTMVELDPVIHPEEYAKWGRFPFMDPWFRRNPDGYAALNPRRFPAPDKVDAVNEAVARARIRRIVFKSDRNRPEATLARFDKDGVRLFVSDDNKDYRPYGGAFTTSVRRENGRNVLEIDGLDIRERYVRIAHAKPYPRDNGWGFAISEPSGDHAAAYDDAGRVLPTYWAVGAHPIHQRDFESLKFGSLKPTAWDHENRVIGFLKGAPRENEGPPRHFAGMAEFLVPKTMEHKLERFKELTEYDFDGFMFNIRNHSDVTSPDDYGYNPEVRDLFLKRHGKDIWKDDFDHALLRELRAEGVSRFLAECKKASSGRPIWFSGTRNRGPGEKQPESPQMVFPYGKFPWQYRQWFADGSVDGVVMISDYFPEYFTPEITGGKKISLGVFREMGFLAKDGKYDFARDLAKTAALPIDEIELYETVEFAHNPERFYPFLRSWREGGLPALEAEIRARSPETVLAQFAARENWIVDYRPEDGLPPPDVWTSSYVPGRLEIVEAPDGGKALRFGNTGVGNEEWPLLRYKDAAALVHPGKTALFEARLRVIEPETPDPKKPNQLHIAFAAVDAAGEASEVILNIGPERLSGSLGNVKAERKLTEFFTLQVALDPNAKTASVWLDGKLLYSGPTKRMTKDGPRLILGDGGSIVGGSAELSRLRFAY